MIERGEKTRLRLRILDENGLPAATGSVSHVLLTTTLGGLASLVENGDCSAGDGHSSCTIPAAAVNVQNADELLIELTHPGASTGRAIVRATVLDAEGGVLSSNQVAVDMAGPPVALAIAAPRASVLNVNAEASEGAEAGGADTDRRDELTLAVTAADEAGAKVELPAGRPSAYIVDSAGRIVRNGVAVEWPLGGDNPTLDLAGNEQVRVDINRAATDPLPNGEYAIRLRAGRLAAEQTFSVSGPPASLTLSELQGAVGLQQEVRLTATVQDAAGEPVPDGTAVRWSETPLGVGVTIIQHSAERATKAGQASATYLVVAAGGTTVQAATGDDNAVADATLIYLAPPPAPPPSLADSLTLPNTVGANTWVGPAPVRASALLAELPGLNVVSVWQGGRWHRYSEQGDGESTDFTIHPNSVIWFTR